MKVKISMSASGKFNPSKLCDDLCELEEDQMAESDKDSVLYYGSPKALAPLLNKLGYSGSGTSFVSKDGVKISVKAENAKIGNDKGTRITAGK